MSETVLKTARAMSSRLECRFGPSSYVADFSSCSCFLPSRGERASSRHTSSKREVFMMAFINTGARDEHEKRFCRSPPSHFRNCRGRADWAGLE